ncbi:hypothetical protein COR50_02095 [Chitinophaga caeni]|uniref:DUF2809 domain-containing protein n=1 Tax=Chitinophaga caeni TaxID=2029983 RepID=A0A291QPX4_9BACT|nr:DUF2809 domain-containing protein [Chitinophaga caeni]ATL46048.1 hypothetical protein COR50_02095 [Chitinophaga caeni]
MLRFHRVFAVLTILLFIIEVIIAVYIHDDFIRPYFGDFLVVMLIYCFLATFVKIPVWLGSACVLVFAYLVELAQYFNLVKLLGLQHSRMANIVIGNHFEWIDILCYTLGVITFYPIAKIIEAKTK